METIVLTDRNLPLLNCNVLFEIHINPKAALERIVSYKSSNEHKVEEEKGFKVHYI